MNDHLWFTLWADREEGGGPTFWFSFNPEGWDFGMGLWPSGNTALERFRVQVKTNPSPAEKLARRLETQEVFTLTGDSYKKHKTPLLPMCYSNLKLRNQAVPEGRSVL